MGMATKRHKKAQKMESYQRTTEVVVRNGSHNSKLFDHSLLIYCRPYCCSLFVSFRAFSWLSFGILFVECENVFLDVESRSTEVDEQAVFDS